MASVTQVRLAEEAIKNGTVVETVSGVINTASFLAKEHLDQCIQRLESDRALEREWLIQSLRTARDRVQMASMVNILNDMVGFGMVDAASSVVHAGIRHLRLQMATAVLGQMERLIAEILVMADALFGGQLINVIVEEVKRAKDWDKFCKAGEHAGLKKIIYVSSRSEGRSSFRAPKSRGGSVFRRPDSSKSQTDQRSGSSPQKPYRGWGGQPFRGSREGGWGASTSSKLSDSPRGEARASGPDALRKQQAQPTPCPLRSSDGLRFRCTVPVQGKGRLQVAPSPLSSRDGPRVRCTVRRMEGARRWVASLPPSLPLENLSGNTKCRQEEFPVAGRLREFLPFWKEITSDQWVLDIIRQGYSIELMHTHPFMGR